jgi:uncharacterized protein YkwD
VSYPVISRRLAPCIAFGAALTVTLPATAGTLDSVQALRASVCHAGSTPRPALREDARLDAAARYWAQGQRAETALERSAYRADASAYLHVSGPARALDPEQRATSCRQLSRAELRDVGGYRRGTELWIILAAPYAAVSAAQLPEVAERTLALVNAARAHPRHCGRREFARAPPLHHSAPLEHIALAQARDMADHGYFDHLDRQGRTPAQRVRAGGYAENLVGENIAYGPGSATEVVAGWLASPGHCENLMTPGFQEMGLGFAPGLDGNRPGLYWVQLLARPVSPQR